MKAKLVLVASERMDSNKKKERREHELIRIGEKARIHLGFGSEKTVELWPEGSTNVKLARTKTLSIYKAFSSDIKKLKDDGMSDKDILNVGFVTTSTFKALCNPDNEGNIWIADSIEEIVFGGDPEFILLNDNGSVRYANDVLSFNKMLGSDGPMAELRPNPEVNVDAFVENIRQLLTDDTYTKDIQKYGWLGGCYYWLKQSDGRERHWRVGGHIHLGNPVKIAKAIAGTKGFKNNALSVLQKILDELVAVPMVKIDGKENTISRRMQYGHYGDRRFKGSLGDRLEYRTLSGQWLVHPVLTAATLGTVKAITHAVFKDIENNGISLDFVSCDASKGQGINHFNNTFDDWGEIPLINEYGATTSNAEMRELLNSAKVNYTKVKIKAMQKRLLNLSTYSEYKKYIDIFCRIIEQPVNVFKKQDTDLKRSWIEGQDYII